MTGNSFKKDVPISPPETDAGSLEWMLHASTVQDAELIRALVQVYYADIYRLALEVQPDAPGAFDLTVQALARAVLHRDRYWGEIPLGQWIGGSIPRRANRKWPQKREQKALQSGEDRTQAEAVAVQAAVVRALHELRRKAKRGALLRTTLLGGFALAAALSLLWLAGVSQLISIPNPNDKVRFYYTYQTLPGDTLASIAQLSGMRAADIRASNNITAGLDLEPGTSLRLASLQPGYWQRLFPRRAAVPPAALSINSSPAAIKKRIQDSGRYWSTLWADRYVVEYEPAGVISGPVNAWREQLWVQQSGEGLLIQKNLGVENSAVGSHFSGIYYDGNRIHEKFDVGPEVQTFFIPSIKSGLLASLFYNSFFTDTTLPFTPPSPGGDWQVKPVGMEGVAGFEALVVDQFDAQGQRRARWWVEARRGVILAERSFATPYVDLDTQPVRYDKLVTRLQFGVKIEPAYLDPENFYPRLVNGPGDAPEAGPYQELPLAAFPNLRFAPDPANLTRAAVQPPPGFERNASQVAMRLVGIKGDNPFENGVQSQGSADAIHMVDVYGDGYYLGTFTLTSSGRPYFNSCDRSADGSLVVLSTLRPAGNIFWFRLSTPQEIHAVAGEPGSDIYAISPSSKQLAYFDCWTDFSQDCGISLLDFDSGVARPFAKITNAYPLWLGWSPDGEQLGAIILDLDSYGPGGDADLKIFGARGGLNDQPVYEGRYNLEANQPAANSPLSAWGSGFQPNFGPDYHFTAKKGCALP